MPLINVNYTIVFEEQLRRRLTYGTGAANEHFGTDSDAGSLAGVNGDGKRFQKRAFFQSHVIG